MKIPELLLQVPQMRMKPQAGYWTNMPHWKVVVSKINLREIIIIWKWNVRNRPGKSECCGTRDVKGFV